jgi:DNA-binding NarL/FixJ family response regulator
MFHPIPPHIGRPREGHPSGRPSRRRGAASVLVAAAAMALLVSVPGAARAANDASRLAREHHACVVVMGLHQPGDLYDTCIASLNKSLSELDQSQLAKSNEIACVQRGLSPGTRAFAVCTVTAEQ